MSAVHAAVMASAASASADYKVANSLRFRASNTTYLTRTPAGAGNRRTMTYSWWGKLGSLSSNRQIFGQGGGIAGGGCALYLRLNDSISFYDGTNDIITTNAKFRDPTAHLHIHLMIDTTQATAANRVRLFINNVEQTYSVALYPAQNTDLVLNQAVEHRISGNTSASSLFDGLMSNVTFVDGQALTPSSFGEVPPASNYWVPKAYTGTYGANGFFLEFKDASAATAAAIGKDTSGNGNNWTPSGISVTAGATFDQFTDTPTNNYPTISPLDVPAQSIRWANMRWFDTGQLSGSGTFALSSIVITSGKWYWETFITAVGGTPVVRVGLFAANSVPAQGTGAALMGAAAGAIAYIPNGQKAVNGATTAYGASYTTGDVIGCAYDADANTVTFYKNGVSQGSISWTAGAGGAKPAWSGVDTLNFIVDINFGQNGTVTPPGGFSLVNTQNFPSAAVTLSGSFTGNAAADGPVQLINGNPATLTINGNAVTFGTHADKIAGGFKLRTSSASYNAAGTNNWTATAGNRFVSAAKIPNNAQVNP
jgi:hypothetical protein